MILSDSQLELLALTLGIDETNTEALASYFREVLPNSMASFMSHVMREPLRRNMALTTQPCTWNMLLRRRCVCRAVDLLICLLVLAHALCLGSYPIRL